MGVDSLAIYQSMINEHSTAGSLNPHERAMFSAIDLLKFLMTLASGILVLGGGFVSTASSHLFSTPLRSLLLCSLALLVVTLACGLSALGYALKLIHRDKCNINDRAFRICSVLALVSFGLSMAGTGASFGIVLLRPQWSLNATLVRNATSAVRKAQTHLPRGTFASVSRVELIKGDGDLLSDSDVWRIEFSYPKPLNGVAGANVFIDEEGGAWLFTDIRVPPNTQRHEGFRQ